MNTSTLSQLLYLISNSRQLGQTTSAAELVERNDGAILITCNEHVASSLRKMFPKISIRSINDSLRGLRCKVVLDNSTQLELVRRLYDAQLQIEQAQHEMARLKQTIKTIESAIVEFNSMQNCNTSQTV